MSAVQELLGALRKKDIRLWVDEGALRYDAPAGALIPQDIEQLRLHKAEIIEVLHRSRDASLPALQKGSRGQVSPLSWGQQALWLACQFAGADAAYHIVGAVQLSGALDAPALRRALDEVVRRHEVLRTVFEVQDGEPVQVIRSGEGFLLREEDLCAVDSAEREGRVEREAEREARERFDLSAGPLIRGALLKLSACEHVLLVTMHHIVADGWSMGILVKELGELYSAYREGRASELAEPGIQYADYAQWERGWLNGEVLREEVRYWTEHLRGVPALLDLPTDRVRPAVQSHRGAHVEFALGVELSGALKELSRRHDMTLYMTLYAGLALVLWRLSGQGDVVIGTPVANRMRAEAETLIGYFVNTLALRIQVDAESPVDELLERVKRLTLAGYAHQHVPFEQVVEAVQPRRTLNYSPLFQVMLALQNAPEGELRLEGLTLTPRTVYRGTVQFDLELSLWEAGGEIRGVCNYATDLFDRTTVESWLAYFQSVLAGMVEDSRRRPAELAPPVSEGRSTLQVPAESHTATRPPYASPMGALEAELAGIWQELLQITPIGRHDNFFELGGYSLLAVRLASRVRDVLDRALTVQDLFEHPTIELLAARLTGARQNDLKPIQRVERGRALPVAPVQRGLWFMQQLDGAGAGYHISGAVHLGGDLDENALRRALDEIVRRHEVLRTVFEVQDGEPVQLVVEGSGFHLRTVDLSAMEADERAEQVAKECAREAQEPLDLRALPLIRGRLLRLEPSVHLLLVTMHHIVADGWSMSILVKELGELYSTYREGRESRLRELPIQYADYAVWERQYLSGETLRDQLQYWKDHLKDAPALLELPTDRARPAVRSHGGAHVEFALSAELAAGLRELGLRHDVTLYMSLYAGLALLLWKLSGQGDVVIGAPVANRVRVEAENLIGYFVNTLPLRVGVSADSPVTQLLEQVKRVTLGGYAHQQVPLQQIIEAAQPPRSLSFAPLFQVVLALQNVPQSVLRLEGLTLSSQPVYRDTSQFDVEFSLWESEGEIRGVLNYATDLFERDTIERWVGHFKTVLAGIVEDPSRLVGSVPLLSASERLLILDRFNETAQAFPLDEPIHVTFEGVVRRNPRAVALEHEEQQLTYAELNQRANQLARYLRERGVRADERVAVCVERGFDMIIALLGILKAGAAYLPLDPAYPSERLRDVLDDARPVRILVHRALADRLPQLAIPFTALDAQWPEIAAFDEENLAEDGALAHHLAYVIYTSGSTGRPRGVMVEHRQLANSVRAIQQAHRLRDTDRLLQFVTLAFDVSAEEIFTTLLSGATLVLRTESWADNPDAFWQLCEQHRITLAHTPTPFWQGVLLATRSAPPSCLHTVIIGGERPDPASIERWFRTGPARPRLINEYGPTEATITATLADVTDRAQASSCIGRPVANTRVYILDERQCVVPVGVAGELYIGGAGVARGYLNRPELTQASFLPDPFGGAGDRIYKSGDLARWRADGTLDFIGRRDQQVKIRGFRVELGDIEAHLSCHPLVTDAVVLLREDDPGEKRLVGYVVGAAEVPVLREYLRVALPEHMIPAAILKLSQLPRTPNGKVDRKALPAPPSDAYARAAYEAPQGDAEVVLAQVWQELLGVASVGRHDHFFELGGHSLLIVRLIGMLRNHGLSVDVRQVFERPRLAELAQAMRWDTTHERPVPSNRIPVECETITPEMLPLVELQSEHIEWIARQVPGGARNVQDIYPLTPLQEGILFHHLMSDTGDAYVMPSLLQIESRTALDGLLSALQATINRHDVLRTALLWERLPRAVQVVQRRAQLAVEYLDVAADEDPLPRLNERMSVRHLRMDLTRAPLMHVQVARDARSDRWYMLVKMHHLVNDHVGLEMLLSEVLAHLGNRVNELCESVPFREHVARALWRARHGDAEEYFRSRLSQVEEPTSPFGLMDVRGDGTELEELQQNIDSQLAERVRASARRLGVSAAAIFHATWGIVMGRCTSRREVVFGSVLSGRLNLAANMANAMGMFVNTLPVKVDLADCSVSELMNRTQRDLAALLDHEHTSLAMAQRCSGMEPGVPLFSTLLNYRHSAPHAPSGDTFEAHGIRLLDVRERTNYPLILSVDDLGEGFSLTVQVDRRVEPRRILEYVQTTLGSIVDALEREPQREAFTLAVVSMQEHSQVVDGFNATESEYPQEKRIEELFEEQVRRSPEEVALEYEGRCLSYAQLNSWSNEVAWRLREAGVSSEQPVGICMERGLEMVVGLLGILKAGGAYVPLDPATPRERMDYQLKDAGAKVIVTEGKLRERLSGSDCWLLGVEECVAEGSGRPDLQRLGGAGSLAYVMYTSGSTGEPKGVMLEHAGIVNALCWAQKHTPLSRQDRVLQKTPFTFDVSVWEIFWPLLNGARLVIARPQGHQDPVYLRELIQSAGITIVHFVPSMLRAFLQSVGAGHCGSVRYLLCSGEALTADLVRLWRECLPGAKLSNLYGPTEASIHVSNWDGEECEPGSAVPIGRPIANTRLYVLDERQQVLPVGVVGEIYIGGVGVARGYLNRPEQTQERFVADPYADQARARMYRTGDLGRWRVDGTLEYLGRNDQQVKIRGFRVELGEIEAQLLKHPQVKDAAAVLREDVPGEKRLAVYVTLAADGAAPTTDELRHHLARALADYMVPAAIVVLERLPVTSSGKLDRKALPVPNPGLHSSRAHEEPRGEVEAVLAQIWREVLHVPRVGRFDSFLDLGGDSLTAIGAVGRIRQAFNRELPLKALFELQTIAAVAAEIGSARQFKLPPLRRHARGASAPLSWSQRRLWFIDRLEGANVALHIRGALRVRGQLALAALGHAFSEVIRRHEILRTTFAEVNGEPVQVVAAHQAFALRFTDARSLTPAEREEVAAREALAEAATPFDLVKGPLFRGRLLQLADDEHLLYLTIHHIIADGWSIGVLMRELAELYEKFQQGELDPLPELTAQFADYAWWQREWLNGDPLAAQLNFWKEHLLNAPPVLELPTDRQRPGVQSHRGSGIDCAFGRELSSQLRILARRLDVTLGMVLHAALGIVLARLSGQSDVVIGVPVVNRQLPDVEPLIGLFANTLAIRTQVQPDQSVEEFLRGMRQTLLTAYENQYVPFEHVIEALQPPRSLSRHPLFQVMFTWGNASGPAVTLPGLVSSPVPIPHVAAQFDLLLSLEERDEEICGGLSYATDLFDRETVERWVGYLRAVLSSMAEDSARSVGSVSLSDSRELNRLLSDFNATVSDYPREKRIEELFEEQVRRSPEEVALEYEGRCLSYAQLNGWANEVAWRLREAGVSSEQPVGICMERGLEMMVGLLGILKAGGAYVPLDPATPLERLGYQLKDAGAKVVVTERKLQERVSRSECRLLRVEECVAEGSGRPDLQKLGGAGSLAYVMYTSGSTGEPKGVMLEHAGIVNALCWAQRHTPLSRHDRVLQKTPFTFDISVWEIFWPLLNGARLVIARPQGHQDPGYLRELIENAGITIVHFVPSMLRAFLQNVGAGHCTSVRYLLCGGEALTADLVRGWRECLPGAKLSNLYGPTEASIHASNWDGEECEAGSTVPIGRPIANTRLYVLDERQQVLPVGVVGEIYIGGVGVARGYVNRPEQTQERFVADPYAGQARARMYRTGDLGRWRVDGTLEYLGRNDHQVKIRGFRVELGEIEAQLLKHPQVKDAAAVLREDAHGEKSLVGYVATHEDGGSSIEELGELLRRVLPEYMVPAVIVKLAELPLTSNGKLDRKALPQPEARARREYEPPEGETEHALAEFWQRLLRIERVGRRDNFFELGGHSLLTTGLQALIRDQWRIELPVRVLFENPILAALAERVDSERAVLCAEVEEGCI